MDVMCHKSMALALALAWLAFPNGRGAVLWPSFKRTTGRRAMFCLRDRRDGLTRNRGCDPVCRGGGSIVIPLHYTISFFSYSALFSHLSDLLKGRVRESDTGKITSHTFRTFRPPKKANRTKAMPAHRREETVIMMPLINSR